MAEYRVDWPFVPLIAGDLDDLVHRWAQWFSDAARGILAHPHTTPERRAEGSWRSR